MAERRMFAKSIVLSDAFLDMPASARALYFSLGMQADDDGFVGSPRSIMRQCGASQDDMLCLLQKRYVLGFDSGVIVIKHWRINNYLQSDRIKPTTYLEEKATLKTDAKGAYTEVSRADTKCIQNVYIGENSIDKYSLDYTEGEKQNKKQNKGAYNNVVLSSEEYTAVAAVLKEYTEFYIERLSAYMHDKGKEYTDHGAKILSWYYEGKLPALAAQQASYDLDAFKQAATKRPEYKKKGKE